MRLRIDDLARAAGTTVRNVRAHTARGLLPPPQMEGRTGWYGDVHLHRLQLIDELQQRGFSLAAVEATLAAFDKGDQLANLLGLEHLLTGHFGEDAKVAVDHADLVARFPGFAEDPGAIERAVRIGLLERAEGGYRVIGPTLLEAGEVMQAAGVGLDVLLELLGEVDRHLAAVAQAYVATVLEHVVRPAMQSGRDVEVERAVATVRRLQPLALEVTRPFLARQLRRAVDEAVAEVVEERP